jgi:hypothetical protein
MIKKMATTHLMGVVLFSIALSFLLGGMFYSPTFFYDLAHSLSPDGTCSSCVFDHFVSFKNIIFLFSGLLFFLSVSFFFFIDQITKLYEKSVSFFSKEKNLFVLLFVIGISLRLILFLATPVEVMYDDHREAIMYLVENKEIPVVEDCYECFHPPVYYLFSAGVYSVMGVFTTNDAYLWKGIQFLSFASSILFIYIIWKILKILFVQPTHRLIGFSFAIFLPRSIYQSVLLSNDTLSYLLLTLFFYFFIKHIKESPEKKFSYFLVACLISILSVLTKLTFLYVPGIVFAYILFFLKGKKRLQYFMLYFFLFLLFVGPLFYHNYQRYGIFIVENGQFFDYDRTPGYIGPSTFLSFHFFDILLRPILNSHTMTSFFTVLFADTWYDHQSLFVIQNSIHFVFAPFLYMLGLFFSTFIVIGGVKSLLDIKDKVNFLFVSGLFLNILFLAMTLVKYTSHTFIKGSYILGSLICLTYFFVKGYQFLVEEKKYVKQKIFIGLLSLFGGIVTTHIFFLSSL